MDKSTEPSQKELQANAPLPQAAFLLELLSLSGDIAIPADTGDTILGWTIRECRSAGWVAVSPVGGGYSRLSITALGKQMAKVSSPNAVSGAELGRRHD